MKSLLFILGQVNLLIMRISVLISFVLLFSINIQLSAQSKIEINTSNAIMNANGSTDGGHSLGVDLQYSRSIFKNIEIYGGFQYAHIVELNDFRANSGNSIFKYDGQTYTDIIVGRTFDSYWDGLFANMGLTYNIGSFYIQSGVGYGISRLDMEYVVYARPEVEETFRLGEFGFRDEFKDTRSFMYTSRVGYNYNITDNWILGASASFRLIDGADTEVIHRTDEENLDWRSLQASPPGKNIQFDVMYIHCGITLGYILN